MSQLVNRRIFSGILIFILLIAAIILSAQPRPARSQENPSGRLVESDDPLVQRAGSWTKQATAGASGGSYLYSGKSAEDTLTLEFVGPRIEIVYVQNPALGALAIEVDDTVLRTVITNGTTPQFGNRAIVDYLENGPHTLKVYPQEGTIIGVDAFYIPAAPPVEPTPTVTAPPSSTPIPRGVDTNKLDEPVIAAAQSEGQIRVIVQLRAPSIGFGRAPFSPRLNLEMQNEVLANAGKFELRHKYSHLPAFAGYADLPTLVQLQADPLVESIVIDEPSTMHTGQSVPAIQADIARNTYGLRGRGVTIAVLDSGIDTNHPDLSDDIIAQHCETAGNCPPSNTTSGISAEDANGHGTNVSGVITSNGVVAPIGFAPDVKIVAVRVLSSTGSGFVSDWVDGLNWIIANQATLNVDLINMSLGTNALYTSTANCDAAQPTVVTAVSTLVNTHGIAIFASSGNQGSATSLSSPSCNTGVVSVGATYDSDLGREPDAGTYNTLFGGTWPTCFDAATNTTTITCFSNSNAELDLLAPGAQITSAGMGGGTSTYRGTSQASPTTAAVAALMLEANPTLTPAQIQSTLYSTGVNVTDSKNGFTFRRINALAAIQAVLPDEVAGAPSNDLFGNAVVVSSLPYRRNQEIYQATTTGTDPSGANICNVTAMDTVWYRYTPGVSQTVSVSTEGSTYDTVIGVYTGTEGALTLVGCNDDTDGIHGIRTSAVNFSATGGTTYRIMIAKYGTASTGTNVLRLSVSNVPFGDTLAIFNNSLNYASLVDTLENSPLPVHYATYPTGATQTGGQWVMGDWNGDGQKTPGVYAPNGVFYFTNGIGYTTTWDGFWIGLYGRPVVVGKFSGAANDCVGAVDSAAYPGYGTAYALYFTCNYAGNPSPPLTFQWLSVVLGDYAGFSGLGAHQFVAGDFNLDSLDSVAVRRGPFIAYTNVVPGTGHAAFDQAQYIGAPSAFDYGLFVSGDWDSDRYDSFGLVYGNGDFYRRNDLQWNTGNYIFQYVGQPAGTINSAATWHQR